MSQSVQPVTKWNLLKLGLQGWLFILTSAVYLLTHFWSLERFPIYFFSDEAIQTVLAADFVKWDFFDGAGRFLPTFFQNVDKYSLGTTVYLQVIPYLVFGKSLIATRGISALVSLLAVAAVSLTMKNVFKSRYWWIGGLLLSITPAWFLHSRTAFEVVTMVSFYAVFIYCYLMYRSGFLRYLYAAVLFGALSFYSYNPGQVVVVATGLLILLLDWRHHWQTRAISGKAAWLLIFFAIPFVRYLIENPGENLHHLETLFSYWTRSIPLSEKLRIYLSNYLFGLNPAYWYFPNHYDLPRHLMKGYGHILLVFAPLALIGLGLVMYNLRSPVYRLVLVALLAAPTGAAIVEISITRILMMVIPLTILTALGLSYCLQKLEEQIAHPRIVSWGLFALLISFNIYMTIDALRNGPLWFQDYGLAGMQYGGEQVFSEIQEYRQNHPQTAIFVSPNWANNVEALERFFLPEDLRLVYVVPVNSYVSSYWPIDSDSVFVLTPDDFELVVKSRKFKDIQVEKELPYPDQKTGFYFVRLKYVNDIQEIFSAEKVSRHVLQEEDIQLGVQLVHVKFSQLDIGQISDVFDNNPESVIRTKEANPLVLELIFPTARPLSGVSLRVGAAPMHILVRIIGSNHEIIKEYTRDLDAFFENRDCMIEFGALIQVSQLMVTIERTDSAEPINVHLWEVQLK